MASLIPDENAVSVLLRSEKTPQAIIQDQQCRLKLMKRDAYIVNTARGEVIDEAAMVRALEAGELGGAALDVFENEPAVNPRLRALSNVVLLPHMSSATLEGRIDMGEKVIINIKTFIDGHKPPDRVIPAML